MTSTRRLAHNAVLNVAGQVVPMVAAAVAIPVLIRGLGAPRFGVLTLAWALIGYFSLFDLGLSRALTQAIATRLGTRSDRDELSAVSSTALSLMLVLGIVGGALLVVLTPWIVTSGLKIPPALSTETQQVLYLLALSLPCVISTAGLRGLMEAHQDFGAATAIRIPFAVFTFLGPIAALPFSSSLVPVVSILVAGRVLNWIAHYALCLKRYDYMERRIVLDRAAVMPLLRYGGWMTASNTISPLMQYVDRFFIGAIMPLTAVTLYVTPYEMVTKLLTLPVSIVGALFPAFATTYAENRAQTAALFERAVRALILIMFPLMLVTVLFASEGLTAWVGAGIAQESAPVLRWLAIGVFLNGIAQAPFAVVQGTGRPDLTAKLHLVEFPLYAGALWWLAHRYGIVGVAMAWTLRVALDTAVLLILALRRFSRSADFSRALVTVIGSLFVLCAAALVNGTLPKIAFLLTTVVAFTVVAWKAIFAESDRALVLRWRDARRSDA